LAYQKFMATKTRKIESNAFSVLGDALESAAESFEEVTVNARDSAKRAAHTTRRALGNGVHKTAYGAAYGVVYASIFLTELWPEDNLWRRGLVEGAAAAIEERGKVRKTKTEKPKTSVKAKTKKKVLRAKAIDSRADEFDAVLEATA
jgi:hypothetical protein